MDFVGQGRAEKLYQIIIVLFGVVGLVWGYTIQQFSQTVYILGAGLLSLHGGAAWHAPAPLPPAACRLTPQIVPGATRFNFWYGK